jgi:hypothetical protein
MRPIIIACAAALVLMNSAAYAQSWQPPADNQGCPSKWGKDDQRGAANLMGIELLKLQGATGSTVAPIAIR